jgi:hypothetical protein
MEQQRMLCTASIQKIMILLWVLKKRFTLQGTMNSVRSFDLDSKANPIPNTVPTFYVHVTAQRDKFPYSKTN